MAFLKKYIIFFILFTAINFDAQQNSIKNISIDNGLPSNIIFDVQQDEIGYLWIATDKGLVKFDGDDFTQINKRSVTNLLIENATIYAGLENGLFIKNKKKEHFLKSKKIIKIIPHNNEIYLGTTEGIYHLKETYLKPLKINTLLDFSIINDIVFTNNYFYVATNNGLWKVNNLQKPKKVTRILEANCISLVNFGEQIITATLQNGLFLVDNESIVKEIATLENISSIKKLKNEVWVTSKTNGLEIFVLPSFSFKQKINKYNSLKTNTVNTVFKDNENTNWIATNNGLYSIKNINQLNKQPNKPIIYFENLQVNHQNVDSLLFAKNVKFLNSDNNVSISFKTVNLSNPNKIKYRYKLTDDFSPWSKNNTVQFPNLNPGRHKLQVQSIIDNKESAIKSFSFIIDAPFYKKAWFNFGLVISLLLIAYVSLDYYIRNINKKNKVKLDTLKLKNRLLTLEQKALQLQMNPHFIFNVLNGIKALGNTNKVDELNTTISKFSVLLRGILNNSRKEEITLQEEINLLKNYIELEQRMSSKSFTYNIHKNLNNIDAEEILIPTMLLQPFIENCVQHAFKKDTLGNIKITFNVKHRFLYCSIVDNGIGIHQSKKLKSNTKHKSVALEVSKERLNILSKNSAFKVNEIVEDNIIKGTNISFKIPLKTDY